MGWCLSVIEFGGVLLGGETTPTTLNSRLGSYLLLVDVRSRIMRFIKDGDFKPFSRVWVR
jgi:hypothetical protein